MTPTPWPYVGKSFQAVADAAASVFSAEPLWRYMLIAAIIAAVAFYLIARARKAVSDAE